MGTEAATTLRTRAAVDASCLNLCISLLDHDLAGDLFESVVVGFLAVDAIDADKMILQEACLYAPKLSVFIKIVQMLVIQKAVVAADAGKVEHPAHYIDEMQERFMLYRCRSPFSWASWLRLYAKKVRNSTTSLGFISWKDD